MAINDKHDQLIKSISDARKIKELKLKRQQEIDDAELKIYKEFIEKSRIKEVSELE